MNVRAFDDAVAGQFMLLKNGKIELLFNASENDTTVPREIVVNARIT
jgi:hypothetical protein